MTAQPEITNAAPAEWGGLRRKEVSWYGPAVLASAGAELSGRELLEAIAGGTLPEPPMARLVGAELVAVGDGEVIFHCAPDEATYNSLGIVHGGLLCTMLDFAGTCAAQTLVPPGVTFSSIEIKVSYLRPIRAENGTLEVQGTALRIGGRVAFAEAHARSGTGELLGHATTTLAVIRAGEGGS